MKICFTILKDLFYDEMNPWGGGVKKNLGLLSSLG
jgi:hypothetical protein